MGNEHSVTLSSATPNSSTQSAFSLFSNRSAKRKGIVTVSDGNSRPLTVENDAVYKRFQDIPRFLPILRNSIGRKDGPDSITHIHLPSRSIFRLALRFQEHITVCARVLGATQNNLTVTMKKIDGSASTLSQSMTKKTVAHERMHQLPDIPNVDFKQIRNIDSRRIIAMFNAYVMKIVDQTNACILENERKLLLSENQLRHANMRLSALENQLLNVSVINGDGEQQDKTNRNASAVESINQEKMENNEAVIEEATFTSTSSSEMKLPTSPSAKLQKYLKMARMGVPLQAVKLKMEAEGVNSNDIELLMNSQAKGEKLRPPPEESESDSDHNCVYSDSS